MDGIFTSLGIGFRNGVAGLIVTNGFGLFMGSSLSCHLASFWSTWLDGSTAQRKNRLESHGSKNKIALKAYSCRKQLCVKKVLSVHQRKNVYLSTRNNPSFCYLPGFRRSLSAFDDGWTKKRMHSWSMACISLCQLHSTSGFSGAELLR